MNGQVTSNEKEKSGNILAHIVNYQDQNDIYLTFYSQSVAELTNHHTICKENNVKSAFKSYTQHCYNIILTPVSNVLINKLYTTQYNY